MQTMQTVVLELTLSTRERKFSAASSEAMHSQVPSAALGSKLHIKKIKKNHKQNLLSVWYSIIVSLFLTVITIL